MVAAHLRLGQVRGEIAALTGQLPGDHVPFMFPMLLHHIYCLCGVWSQNFVRACKSAIGKKQYFSSQQVGRGLAKRLSRGGTGAG